MPNSIGCAAGRAYSAGRLQGFAAPSSGAATWIDEAIEVAGVDGHYAVVGAKLSKPPQADQNRLYPTGLQSVAGIANEHLRTQDTQFY